MLLAKAAKDEYVLDRLLPEDEAPVEAVEFRYEVVAEQDATPLDKNAGRGWNRRV